MRKLTAKEEISILEYIKNKSQNKRGSSRVAIPYGKNCVVKVAKNTGGLRQSRNEIELYKAIGNEYLTTIYAYGRYVIIAEKVNTSFLQQTEYIYDYRDNDYYQNKIGRLNKHITQNVDFIIDGMNILDNWLGETGDNSQWGVNKNNVPKCFDYGFDISNGSSHDNYDFLTDGRKLTIEQLIKRLS